MNRQPLIGPVELPMPDLAADETDSPFASFRPRPGSSATTSANASDSLSALIRAARQAGLRGIVATLSREIGASTALFDLNGNTLAATPARTIWDYRRVLAATLQPKADALVSAVQVLVDNEPVAILSTATTREGAQLLAAGMDLVTLEVARLRARQDGRRELAQHLIEDLIHGRLADSEATARLSSFGLNPQGRYRVLLGHSRTRQERLLSVPWSIYTLMSDQHEPFLRVVLEGRILMLVPDDAMVDNIARHLLKHLQDIGTGAVVGVSAAYTGITGIRAGYFEALSAAATKTGVQHPDHVDLGRLLTLTNTTIPLSDIATAALKPLLDYDADHDTELVATLRAFLAADQSFAATATALFIHRNTLRYRLRRIEELLGQKVSGTRRVTNLWLALQALAPFPDSGG